MNYEINNRITQIFFSRSLICLSYTVYLVYNSYDLIHFVVLIIMSNLIVFMFNVSTGMPFKSYLSTLLHTHRVSFSFLSLSLCRQEQKTNLKFSLKLFSFPTCPLFLMFFLSSVKTKKNFLYDPFSHSPIITTQ